MSEGILSLPHVYFLLHFFLFLNNSQIKINQIPLQTMHMIILLAQPPLSKIT